MFLRWLRCSNIVKQRFMHLDCHNVFAKTTGLPSGFTTAFVSVSRSGRQMLQHSQHQSTLQISRFLHTSRPRYVNPMLIAVLRPLSRVAVILVGRGFRKWWQSLPAEKRTLFIQHFRRNKYRYIGGSLLIGGAGYSYYEEHVVPAPLTGRRRFIVFSPDQLRTIAHHTYTEEVGQFSKFLMPENHPMVNQVRRVGNQLLQANRNIPQLYTKSWTVTVIDHPTVNCYVLPSGDIVMFRGMMDLLENDDQVAAVIAHEMSHAILEHASEQLSRGYLLDILILFPLAVIWAFIPSDGVALVTQWFLNQVVNILLELPYSRSLEEEADTVGLQLAAKACFDVREASAFWGKLDILDELHKRNNKEKAEDPAWLSTHPSNSERMAKIDAQMEEVLSIRNFCQCPKLREQDPRSHIKSLREHLHTSRGSQDSRSL